MNSSPKSPVVKMNHTFDVDGIVLSSVGSLCEARNAVQAEYRATIEDPKNSPRTKLLFSRAV